MEEERRLLYVAVTRAQASLSLSWAGLRDSAKGKAERRTVSRFVEPLLPPRASSVVRGEPRVPRHRSLAKQADADADRGLVDRLMEWRRTRARQDGVPAYVVAHDAHLRAIAAARPSTHAELLGMPGMGPVKAERYGDDILAIIRDTGSGPGH